MKRILLVAVNAKYIHMNLAIHSLRAFVKKQKKEWAEKIFLEEYTINQQTDDMLQSIYKKKPDVLAFSCYIWNIEIIKELILDLKKVHPSCSIWLGGPEVSYDATKTLEALPQVQGVMRGEGELSFLRLVEYYQEEGKRLEKIDGITFRNKEGAIIENKDQACLNLDDIPFPYENFSTFQHQILYYEASRGCPFSCSYCLSSTDRKVRFRSKELIEKELQCFLDARVPQVKFVDRTFNCKKEHTRFIWEFIKKHDNGITNFHFEIAAELLTEEEIQFLNQLRPGLVQLEIGVQTTNKKTLSAISRKADVFLLKEAVKKLIEPQNIHIHLDLIAGLPYEDLTSFQTSFQEVYKLAPQQLQLGFLKVLKGTEMERNCKEYHILYKEKPPYEVLATKELSYEDILTCKLVERMLELYYNSGQFHASIRFLEHRYSNPFSLYLDVGKYYERRGLLCQSQSRVSSYQALFDFYQEIEEDLEKQDAFLTLLTYDFYLRENAKSRPKFAHTEKEKEKIRRFFELGRYREILPAYKELKPAQVARMTHVEMVEIDIEQTIQTGNVCHTSYYVLFDYQKRNPLTHNASCLFFTKQDWENAEEKESK